MDRKPSLQNAIKLEHFYVTNFDLNLSKFNRELEHIENKLEISVETNLGRVEDSKNIFIVGYEIKITNLESSYILNMVALAVFKSKDELTDDSFEADIYKISAPAIGFPFVRSFINTVSINAGYNNLIIPAYSFIE